jgi:hypothetical protein
MAPSMLLLLLLRQPYVRVHLYHTQHQLMFDCIHMLLLTYLYMSSLHDVNVMMLFKQMMQEGQFLV